MIQNPNPKKVIVRVIGGLGNQLFSYAAARRLAINNDCELIIDDVSGFKYDTLYQRSFQLDHFSIPCRKATAAERLEPFSRIRRYLLRKRNKSRDFFDREYLQQEFLDYDKRLLEFNVGNELYIEGYWQSEKYFLDQEKQIRQDLRIIPPVDEKNIHMGDLIQSTNAVALHLRYFDAADVSGADNLAGDYYQQAIKYLEGKYPDLHYFVFSDRPDLAESALALPASRMTQVFHNKGDDLAYADLWLMHLCKHFIIANSTFSWWGAWLSGHENKAIVAPALVKRQGVSWWGFDGLLPDSWVLL